MRRAFAVLSSLIGRVASACGVFSMASESKKEMKQGLDCYDPERRVFQRLPRKLKRGHELCKRDVLLILKWKIGWNTRINSKTVANANMATINQAIRDAGNTDPNRQIDALKTLDKIPGIGLATASAILTVCYPDRFTIIDRRVLERLKLFPSKPKHKRKQNTYIADNWTSEGYLNEFLPEVEKRSKQWRCQLRTADRALWGLSVCEDVERIIASS